MKKHSEPIDALKQDPQAAALLGDRKALGELLGSREAQTLAQMFRQLGGDGLQAAATSAAQGDGAALQAILGKVMSDPKGAQAMEDLRRKTDR